MRKVVGFVRNFGWPVSKQGYEEIGAEYAEIPCQTEDEIMEATKDADAVFVPGGPFTRRVIEHMRRCRIISVVGIGYDNVDLEAVTDCGICVSNVPGFCVEEVSDQAMALLLACARKIVRQVIGVKAGKWDSLADSQLHAELPPISRLRGQTLGIIGLGQIGRALVPKAKGFGMKVIAFDPYIVPSTAHDIRVDLVEFDYLLENSDFISLHIPLTDKNRHILGLEQFKKMKASAFLINTARGALIDEKALYTAVSEGYIAGAGLDVVEQEPCGTSNPLVKLDNILITPHTAHYSKQSRFDVLRRSEEEVFRVLGGGWPQNFVNPQVKENYIKRWVKHRK